MHCLSAIQRLFVPVAMGLLALPAAAQFSSGSTGQDGALVIGSDTEIALQEDGVHNYTTITVATSATLTFVRNTSNLPVILLASGDVTINGTISVKGEPGLACGAALAGVSGSEAQPGPGGFPGGIGAVGGNRGGTNLATSGGGPGGGLASKDPTYHYYSNVYDGRAGNGGSHFGAGHAGTGYNEQPAAPKYGDPDLITLSGGSGGAGGASRPGNPSTNGPGGGAGGGAILIASSGTITVNGEINADGGDGQDDLGAGTYYHAQGSGGGAGGAVRLMANTITGTGHLYARGGGGANAGGAGKIRIQAFNYSGSLDTGSSPYALSGAPTMVRLPDNGQPTIKIVTVGGLAVADPATGMTNTPDVTVPSTTGNPVVIGIATTNIPDGAAIVLHIVQTDARETSATSTRVSAGSATATVDLSAGIGVIYATAVFDPGY